MADRAFGIVLQDGARADTHTACECVLSCSATRRKRVSARPGKPPFVLSSLFILLMLTGARMDVDAAQRSCVLTVRTVKRKK